jgi:hypothetical protein
LNVDFEPVVEKRQPERRAALRIIRMNHGVDDRFAQCRRRQRPTVVAPDFADHGFARQILADEGDGLFDGLHGQTANFRRVQNPAAVNARKAPRLNPGIGKMFLPVALAPEKQHPADRRTRSHG